ncbi:MAG TPA: hypothetical protein VFW19_02540 [Allosphingosinicella sp.]|nr:hypothetical protein [Allosphingosinicella sp.]
MKAKARARAKKTIKAVFANYRRRQPTDGKMLSTLQDGKLYELFVLSQLVVDLNGRGFTLHFVPSPTPSGAAAGHSTLKFKGSPGKIKATDSHFEVSNPGSGNVDYRIFVNIEFDTLGHSQNPVSDNSRRHELDIVVTTASAGYPTHEEIALGVECKAVANFQKGLLKEALGVRRELSFLTDDHYTLLTRSGGMPVKQVTAYPPSEFILAFIDPKGTNYAESPKVFGIELQLMQP